jgi:plastocyanin
MQMRRINVLGLGTAACLLVAVVSVYADTPAGTGTDADPIVIVMEDNKFTVKQGGDLTTAHPVELTVGQTVVWKNVGCNSHTASSVKKDANNKRLFDTGSVDSMQMSKKVVFDDAMYKAHGGTPPGKVDIDYLCTIHGKKMSGKFVLKAKE